MAAVAPPPGPVSQQAGPSTGESHAGPNEVRSHIRLIPATAHTKPEPAGNDKPTSVSEKPNSRKAEVKAEADEKDKTDGAKDKGEWLICCRLLLLFGSLHYKGRVERHSRTVFG